VDRDKERLRQTPCHARARRDPHIARRLTWSLGPTNPVIDNTNSSTHKAFRQMQGLDEARADEIAAAEAAKQAK